MPVSAALQRLQAVDLRVREVQVRIGSCDPRLAEVGATVEQLEAQAETTSGRVEELRAEERRLQRSSSDKRLRLQKLDERLREVKTAREEAAVQTETGLVRRVLESEEQEAMGLLEQIERLDARLADQQAALEEARSAAEPSRREILAEKEAAAVELAALGDERKTAAMGVDPRWLRVYDSLIRSGRESAVAPMSEDGACGVCFSVIPLQVQHEIRAAAGGRDSPAGPDHGRASTPLVICEACGVIVTAPETGDPGGDEQTATGE